jgi:large subunit ribosomal protein L39e
VTSSFLFHPSSPTLSPQPDPSVGMTMASKKPLGKKLRLLRAEKSNRRVPAWIMIRTSRRFTSHPHRRSWRKNHLKE